ncbi:hypothetical protein GTP91_27560 [Rugamonas sp. FT82W]|uniref:DUF3820 family protein n=1 Tax=Duganella vulcania TaxID=2692166 RepID=A0A845GDP8_9BURK|nr:DUF3820 family protein [Duganella vulcania]MYM90919.1 hypothetical protein [Duganella vulcania]
MHASRESGGLGPAGARRRPLRAQRCPPDVRCRRDAFIPTWSVQRHRPSSYLGWFAREGFPSGELGGLLALMYELDQNDLRSPLDPLRRARQR